MVAVGDTLPDPDEVLIPDDKLRGYALNPDHVDGTHKARVFYSALGIAQHDAEYLREHIRDAIRTAPITDVRPCYNGVRCSVLIAVPGLNGREAPVVTGWRIPDDGSPTHLTTLYVDA